jgi:benzylsuccinate CoA-transferase BbsF subunit
MNKNRPFEGLKVIEFGWAGVGPFSVSYLGYFGATIIKMESTSYPDIVRTSQPYKDGIPGIDRSGFFAYTHMVKKHSISLNLKHPQSAGLKRKLIEWADVVVDNFSAGTLEKWGFGYNDLIKIKPDIIAMHTCLYGRTGPLAGLSGTGLDLTTLCGFNSIAGWEDRAAVPISSYYSDNVAPLFGGFSLIAALDYKRRTGKGQFIDMSQLEAGIQFLSPLILDYVANNREISRHGNSLPYAAPHGAYRCKGQDRWCAIGVFSDKQWQSFCNVIGNPDWTRDDRFSTMSGRVENSAEIDKLVNAWTGDFTAEQVMAMMQAAGVSAGLVSDARDQAEDPQFKYYNAFPEKEHPVMGKLTLFHPRGFRLSEAELEVDRSPLLGEDTEYVVTKLLGVSDDEFVQLMEQGVFN